MIKDNTIYFGYGTIAVGSNIINSVLTFQEIKPPTEVGTSITEELEKKLEWGTFIQIKLKYFNEDVMQQLSNIVNQENKQIKIEEYILDFNKYNSESVKIIKKHVNYLKGFYRMSLAC